MIRPKLERYLRVAGYYSLPSSHPEFSVFVKIENGFLNALQIIYYDKGVYISVDQYQELKEAVKKSFRDKNLEVHIMTLVLHEDCSKAMQLVVDEPFCWFIDTTNNSLYMDESRVEDFYGLKAFLDKFLNEYIYQPDDNDEIHMEEEMTHFLTRSKYYLMDMPKITVCLVAINIILFILCKYFGDFIYSKGQLGLGYILKKEYYRLISAMFLHADLQHISSNMVLLYFMGDMLERILKKSEFLLVFLLSGILGNVISCIYEYAFQISMISIGASGAIYGLIGCLFFMVIRKKPPLEISFSRMLVMIAYCIYSSFAGSNINVAAHLGGLIAGFFIGWFLSLRRQNV